MPQASLLCKFASMTIHEANQQLLFQLYHLYDNREAANIADWVMENITGWKRIDRIINKQVPLSQPQTARLSVYTSQLMENTPVQYVLNESWFYGMKLWVNKDVLIPRPETEELVEWIVNDIKNSPNTQKNILDIGTGSGCIPLALKKTIPQLNVASCDISAAALKVAQKNAEDNNLSVRFLHLDFLNNLERDTLEIYDIIVSNPPYIPDADKTNMDKNVLLHEPHLALFVPDNDALVFYKTLIDFSVKNLSADGCIYLEIHEQAATAVEALFQRNGFTKIFIKKDMQGKDRMVNAAR
jgi:release factor glutamine methyltransferase